MREKLQEKYNKKNAASINNYKENGQRSFQQRKYTEAVHYFESGIKIAPSDPDFYYYLGCTKLALKYVDEAIENFNLAEQCQFYDIKIIYISRAQAFVTKRSYQKAIEEYTIIFDKLKNSGSNSVLAEILSARGLSYLELPNIKPALQDFEAAMKCDPNNADANYGMASYYFKSSNYIESEKFINRSIEINSKSPDSFYLRGRIHMINGNYQAAIDDIEISLGAGMKSAELYHNVGFIYIHLKKYDLALSYLSDSISMDAKNSANYHLRAFTYYSLGLKATNQEEKKELYKKSLNDSNQALKHGYEDKLSVYQCMGNVQVELDNYEAAVENYTKAIQVNPEAKLFKERSEAFRLAKKYPEAYRDLKHALEIDKNILDLYQNWFSIGLIYLNNHDYINAKIYFKKAIESDNNNYLFESHFNYALACMNLQLSKEAILSFDDAAKINAEISVLFKARACAYIFEDQISNALKDLNFYLSLKKKDKVIIGNIDKFIPYHPMYYNLLGLSYMNIKKFSPAIKYFNKIAERRPDTFNYIACCYLYTNDLDQAIKNFNTAIELDTNYGEAYFYRGQAFQLKGEKTKAKENFIKATQCGYSDSMEYLTLLEPEIRSLYHFYSNRPRSSSSPSVLYFYNRPEIASCNHKVSDMCPIPKF